METETTKEIKAEPKESKLPIGLREYKKKNKMIQLTYADEKTELLFAQEQLEKYGLKENEDFEYRLAVGNKVILFVKPA